MLNAKLLLFFLNPSESHGKVNGWIGWVVKDREQAVVARG